MTLRFLGRASIGVVDAALDTMVAATAVARLGPAVTTLGDHAVTIPVAGLDGLAAAVVAATEDLGEPSEPRPFVGHLTVARIKAHGSAAGLVGHPIVASFPVGEVTLVRSDLQPAGPRYRPVACYQLAV